MDNPNWYHIEQCYLCKGRGFIEIKTHKFDDISMAEECPICNGEGELRVKVDK